MSEIPQFATCPSCAEEIQPAAIRCRHCGHSLVGEGWIEDVRAYARLSPQQRLEWIRTLTPEQGRRFRQVWRAIGPDAEREALRTGPNEVRSKTGRRAEQEGRSDTTFGVLLAILAVLVLVALGGIALDEDSVSGTVALAFLVVVAALYFLPMVIAIQRNHHQAAAIVVINIFLGWTFLGWVVALALACSAVRST